MTQSASLLELQRLDIEILRAGRRLDELPEKRGILELRSKLREVSSLRGKADTLVAKLTSDLKAHQDETTMLTEKIDAEQSKVMQTTEHRQVAAITREMDGLKRRRDKVEMESLQLMERIDKAQGQIGTIDAALGQLAEQEADLISRFRATGGALKAEIADLERRREITAQVIEADTVSRYETARESKGGVGVGMLEGETCSACRMSLPAERVRELECGPDIAICPQCRRLIVVRVDAE